MHRQPRSSRRSRLARVVFRRTRRPGRHAAVRVCAQLAGAGRTAHPARRAPRSPCRSPRRWAGRSSSRFDGAGAAGPLPDGRYEAEITVTDVVGTVSQRVPFTIDTVPPELRLVSDQSASLPGQRAGGRGALVGRRPAGRQRAAGRRARGSRRRAQTRARGRLGCGGERQPGSAVSVPLAVSVDCTHRATPAAQGTSNRPTAAARAAARLREAERSDLGATGEGR